MQQQNSIGDFATSDSWVIHSPIEQSIKKKKGRLRQGKCGDAIQSSIAQNWKEIYYYHDEPALYQVGGGVKR